jgi:hypothetical protein
MIEAWGLKNHISKARQTRHRLRQTTSTYKTDETFAGTLWMHFSMVLVTERSETLGLQ